jgi:hypothetical protein
VFLLIVFVCVLRSLTIVWKICLYLFGVWILRSALLRSTALNPMDHLEHLISKVNWVNFEINSILPSLLLVFVEKVLTCLFTPPLGNFQPRYETRNPSNFPAETPKTHLSGFSFMRVARSLSKTRVKSSTRVDPLLILTTMSST